MYNSIDNTDIRYEIVDAFQTSEGFITRIDIEYSTNKEQELVELTHGSRNGRSSIQTEFGEESLVYTANPQNFDEKRVDEVMVPESVAYGSLQNFVETALTKYAETDRSQQWATEGLDHLGDSL
mgnify:CR=1 FL=1